MNRTKAASLLFAFLALLAGSGLAWAQVPDEAHAKVYEKAVRSVVAVRALAPLGERSGSGVILLSVMMAAGLEGAAVIATDAAVSVVTGVVKVGVFGLAGALTPQVIVIACLIGAVTFPCTFVAKLIVERMPVHVHTTLLDAVVIVGGLVMIAGAFR